MSIPSHLPGVTYGPTPRAAADADALPLPPRLVVVHDTSNNASAANEAHFAATRTDAEEKWTSAHFYVDAGGPLGSLPLNIAAWAAYSYANSHGWHIEMCGTNAGTTGAVPAVTIAHTAALVRTLCQLGGIPMVKLTPADVAAGKRGICGHRDITQGLHVGTHDDPGAGFDWSAFIAQVQQPQEDDMDKDTEFFIPANATLSDMTRQGDGGVRFADWVGWVTYTLDGLRHAQPPAAAVDLTDAQLQAVADKVAAQVGGKLDTILARLAKAGDALDG